MAIHVIENLLSEKQPNRHVQTIRLAFLFS